MHRQHCQTGCHVLILHQNVVRHFQMGRGKGPDGLDAAGDQLVSNLLGIVEGGIDSDEPVILAADDLAPSETIQTEICCLIP